MTENNPITAGELRGKRLAHGKFVISNLFKLLNEHTDIKYETLEDKIGFCIELVKCIEEVQLELENSKIEMPWYFPQIIDDLLISGVWSVRTHHVLDANGIYTLFDLVQKREGELLKMGNFGTKSLREVVNVLDEIGLYLEMTLDEYGSWVNDKKQIA